MKKITNLLIVCSLALAGAVMAQQPTPEESQPPGKNPKSEKKAPAEVKPKASIAPKTEVPPVKEPALKEAPAPTKPEKTEKKMPPTKKPAPEMSKAPTDQPATTATAAPKKEQAPKQSKDKTMSSTPAPTVNASPSAAPSVTKATPTPATAATAKATMTPATAASASAAPSAPAATGTPATTASASAAPSISQTSPSNSVTSTTAAVKKPDPQKVEQIRQQHTSFRAQARPDRAPAVTFSANFRLPGVEQWQGPRYEVYRSYHPERHDQGWYRSHYQRVELIAGGYYYFNNGYWYPAWGYNPSNEYYAYDAPIYAGKHAEPPDKVIADVQAVLQEMGYYKGEVDGLLGPLTREALMGYQRDNGMTVTAVIDEPTLEALNMG